ncbi:hypothetical protein [Anaerobaca lacustris]|uniref:Uncharacterized protein n=1 Tax=Anaerobaca lacustris TaxID=3044600 RepID=A0AAW6TX45_9BACT|nr:hypothetical protein [Sedimentisphaerales bacterium M17dextr]
MTDSVAMPMLGAMSTREDNLADDGPHARRHETVGGMLTSALNMEDEISSGVYEDYLDHRHWPAQLDDDVFVEIGRRLTVLIDDTKKHKKILQALVNEYGKDE